MARGQDRHLQHGVHEGHPVVLPEQLAYVAWEKGLSVSARLLRSLPAVGPLLRVPQPGGPSVAPLHQAAGSWPQSTKVRPPLPTFRAGLGDALEVGAVVEALQLQLLVHVTTAEWMAVVGSTGVAGSAPYRLSKSLGSGSSHWYTFPVGGVAEGPE